MDYIDEEYKMETEQLDSISCLQKIKISLCTYIDECGRAWAVIDYCIWSSDIRLTLQCSADFRFESESRYFWKYYDRCISFEEVMERVSDEVRAELLFHLDLFA